MNVDLFVAVSLFVVFLAFLIYHLLNLGTHGTNLRRLLELRKEAIDFTKEIISPGNPGNWEKERIIPSDIGLASFYYSIQLSISDTSGYDRINEPVSLYLSLDESCNDIAWNETIRIYDENFREIPFRFVRQEFCPSGYLRSTIIFFEVNVSANSSRSFQILFSNITSVKFKDYGNFSNLVAWLTFDEGSGTIAYDYSGNNNHGILYNGTIVCGGNSTHNSTCPQWVDGRFGKAVKFDGIDDYSVVQHSQLLDSLNYSLIVWMRAFDLSGKWRGIVTKNREDGGGSNRVYGIWTSSTTNYLHFRSGTNAINIQFSDTQNFHMLTLVAINNGQARVYINGSLVGSFTDNRIFGNYNLHIGRANFTGTTEYFNGTIDEIRVYNKALTEQEIISYYQQPLQVKVFPPRKVDVLSFEKINALRNFSYDIVKEAIQKGYNFRIEIYEK